MKAEKSGREHLHKVSPREVSLNIDFLTLVTTRPIRFINELEKLCRKHATHHEDYFFKFEVR